MVKGLGWAARGGWRACSEGQRGAEAASRRLKRAALAGQPDVNQSSPSSIGPVCPSGGQSALACDPVAPVAFPGCGVGCQSIWMGRSEPRDANGLAGIVAE
jgi:hypothetical protein